jgi:hypothetical protein
MIGIWIRLGRREPQSVVSAAAVIADLVQMLVSAGQSKP